MMAKCKDCHLSESLTNYPSEDDDIMFCAWEPEGGLPTAWEYAPREVIAMHAGREHDCPQFKPIKET
jgi:hypothetical protein